MANYWRRYFNIEEIPYSSHSTEPYEELTLHDMPDQPEDEEQPDDEADDTSTMGNMGDPTPSVPMQISQLAHILYQALIQDRVFNAPVLEKLQIPPENPSESNLRLFTASELAHLGSHLSIITNILARQANPDENLSAISDELDREIP